MVFEKKTHESKHGCFDELTLILIYHFLLQTVFTFLFVHFIEESKKMTSNGTC
jgi:hypothetical protein